MFKHADNPVEEEKREERAKKEEERAKKAEEKRRRDEEKHKPKAVAPVVVAETSKEEPTTSASPTSPVLDSIPQLAPLTIVDTPPITDLNPETTGLLPTSEPNSPIILVNPVVTPNVADVQPVESEERPVEPKTQESTVPSAETSEAKETTLTKSRNIEPISTGIAPASSSKTATTADNVPTSPKGDQGKLSSWLKTKFSRHGSKSVKQSDAPKETISAPEPKPTANTPSTVIIPAGPIEAETPPVSTPTTTSYPEATTATIAVPTDGATSPQPLALSSHPPRSRSTSISSLSSDEPTHPPSTFVPTRGRSRDQRIHPSTSAQASSALSPPALKQETTTSTTEEGSVEEFEEARDHFDAETLPLPAPSFAAQGRQGAAGSPVRDSRFVEDL